MKDVYEAKIFFVALTALMFSLALIPAGSAAIGVKEGDWAKYQIEAQIPEEIAGTPGFEELEETDWIKVEVESVSGTSVTLKGTMHFKNETEVTETIPETEATGLVIEADLGEGDEVTAPMFGMSLYINGTVSRTYAGVSREVNYVDIAEEEAGMSVDFEAYWDKETGILCEMAMSMSGAFLGQTIDMSMSVEMTETNLWEAGLLSGQWFWILVIVVIIVAVVVAGSTVLVLRRRKAPLPEVGPAPTE